MKRDVWMIQTNFQYGNAVYLPFSVGMLQAYAQSQADIASAYIFRGFVYLREPIADVVKRLAGVQVAAFAQYVWNSVYQLALAKAVKKAYPACLIVMGGPHIPDRSEAFLKEHTFVDVLAHGEGEHTFADILKERLRASPDYSSITGVSVRGADGVVIKTPDRVRLANLDSLPSPYLTGVFDNFPFGEYEFNASQETHRGCPFLVYILPVGNKPSRQGKAVWRRTNQGRIAMDVRQAA